MSLEKAHSQDSIFDAIDAGLVVLNAGRLIVGWNQWMRLSTGVPASAARGRTLDDVLHGVFTPRLAEAVGDALTSGVSSVLPQSLNRALLPLRTRDGRP